MRIVARIGEHWSDYEQESGRLDRLLYSGNDKNAAFGLRFVDRGCETINGGEMGLSPAGLNQRCSHLPQVKNGVENGFVESDESRTFR